jgi:hypothetical protein
MATKRKPKSEPIMNAEPLKSDGVIVTHRDRHITPGNASVTWLVVMMAIIGVAGAFCTYIWWQKEALEGSVILRNRATQVKTCFPLSDIVERLKEIPA